METEIEELFNPLEAQELFEQIMAPDALLAGQDARNSQIPPEIALLQGILRQALVDLRWTYLREYGAVIGKVAAANLRLGKHLLRRQEIVDWYMNDSMYPFSFVFVCEGLDVEPSYERKAIAKVVASWKATGGRVPAFYINKMRSLTTATAKLDRHAPSVSKAKPRLLRPNYHGEEPAKIITVQEVMAYVYNEGPDRFRPSFYTRKPNRPDLRDTQTIT